jgi:Leu/Phe-tRNA-protein transferase
MVSNSGGSVFSTSSYLDATAQNWCVLVDDDYSKGIALPYTDRLGVKMIYTPVFLRYLEFLNGEFSQSELNLIQASFSIGELQVQSIDQSVFTEKKQFQLITSPAQFQLNEQARRMIRKFDNSGLQWQETRDAEEIIALIEAELSAKVKSLNQSMNELKQLTQNLSQKGYLRSYIVRSEEQIVGGIFFVEFNGRLLYLKSAFKEEAKKAGAMYAVLRSTIQSALEREMIFDFGGSNVENVRRFNMHFGASDVDYCSVSWGELPRWYRVLQRLRQVLKRG